MSDHSNVIVIVTPVRYNVFKTTVFTEIHSNERTSFCVPMRCNGDKNYS